MHAKLFMGEVSWCKLLWKGRNERKARGVRGMEREWVKEREHAIMWEYMWNVNKY